MKSTFIVMAASALIAVPLYAQEVDVTGSSPSAPASPADNAFEVMPWIGLGAGWRGIWIDRDVGGTDSRHGIDLVRLTAGVDYRLNSQFPFLLTPASPHDVSLAGACRPRRFQQSEQPRRKRLALRGHPGPLRSVRRGGPTVRLASAH